MLALTAALVAPYFIDWTSYRSDFEREASRILGRAVKVEGSASARLLPFPSVTFTDVVVSREGAAEPSMTVERFSMDAELAPFMRGDFHIFDMRLVRPVVMMDVAADGTLDWTVRPSVPLDASHISLEKLTITEGKVTLRHGPSGRVHMLNEVNADVSARALTGPWRLDGSMRLDGLRSAVSVSTGAVDGSGMMRLRLRVQPELYPLVVETDGAARIEEGAARYSGQFRLNASTAGERLRTGDGGTISLDTTQPQERNAPPPAYRLSGDFDFGHSGLAVEQFRFQTGSLEDPYTAEGSARFDLGPQPRFELHADGAQFRFDGSDAQEGGSASFAERFAAVREFLLDLPRPTIPGSIEVALPAIVAGDTTVREVMLSASPSEAGWTIASLRATLPGRTTLEAKGELALTDRMGFAGDLLLAIGQPSGFATWLSRDVDEAIRRLPSAGFSAAVELSEERQQFRDLELILGIARFRGEIDSRTPASEHPSMTLKLDGDALDMEGMSAFASLFLGEGGQTRLAERDLEFEIKAGPVSAAGLSAETLDTALRLRGGRLDIDRLAIGGLAGANISATGALIDPGNAPTGTLDASIIAADLQPLAEALASRFPDYRLATEFARRAALYPGFLEDANLKLIAEAAAGGQGRRGLTLDLSGEAGGTSLAVSASADDLGGDWGAMPIRTQVSVRNDDAAALYALFGLPSLPFGLAGPGRATIAFDGASAQGGRASFSFEGDGLLLTYDGDAAMGEGGLSASGTAALHSDDVEPWLAVAGVSLPGFGFGLPVSLESQLDLDKGLLLLSGLSGQVTDEAASGDLNVQMRDGLPHLTGSLSLGSLDLMSLAEMAVGAPALAGDGEDWPTAPFSPSISAFFTTDLEIAAERLLVGSFGMGERARLTLRLGRDAVSISDATAEIFGGTASGLMDFRNDGGTGIVSTQMRLAGAGASSVLGDIGVGGTVDLTAALTGSAKTADALMASLAGSGTVAVRDLSISGIDPDAFPTLIAAADGYGPDINAAATAAFAPELVRRGAFEVGTLDFAFTVANGTARVPPIRLETEAATLSGELRADLGQSTVGADMLLTYAAGHEALVGSEPSVRIAASGPLDRIETHVDTGPLTQFLTQRALELEQQRVEAMQAALLERQRHRREVRYYESLADEREKAAEEARRAVEQAERLRREVQAQEDAARWAAEEERLRRENEDAERLRLEEERSEVAPEPVPASEEENSQTDLLDQVEALLAARVPAAAESGAPQTPETVDLVPTPRPEPGAFQMPADPVPQTAPSSDGFMRMIFGE